MFLKIFYVDLLLFLLGGSKVRCGGSSIWTPLPQFSWIICAPGIFYSGNNDGRHSGPAPQHITAYRATPHRTPHFVYKTNCTIHHIITLSFIWHHIRQVFHITPHYTILHHTTPQHTTPHHTILIITRGVAFFLTAISLFFITRACCVADGLMYATVFLIKSNGKYDFVHWIMENINLCWLWRPTWPVIHRQKRKQGTSGSRTAASAEV